MFLPVCVFIILGSIGAKSQSLVPEDDSRPDCKCGNNQNTVSTRVVGGHNAGNGNFPFASCLIAKISMERNSPLCFCGATLITDSHVITAAHCVKFRTVKDFLIDVGDYDFLSGKNELREALTITKYPEYKPHSFHTDIAVIELVRPMKWKPNVRSVWLPPSNLPLPEGTTVSVYGWGRLEYDGSHPKILQSLELPIVKNNDCQKTFRSKIEPQMLCAGGEEGHDACIGDSGSGLVVRLDNEYVLCGIVSFGRRCALKHIAGVYTRVSEFVAWIYNNTMSSQCKPCIYSGDVPLSDDGISTENNGTALHTDKRIAKNYSTPVDADENISENYATPLDTGGTFTKIPLTPSVTESYVTPLDTDGNYTKIPLTPSVTENYVTPLDSNESTKGNNTIPAETDGNVTENSVETDEYATENHVTPLDNHVYVT